MAKRKVYQKLKKRFTKGKKKSRVSKSFKRDFYRVFLKYVDKKVCVLRNTFSPSWVGVPASSTVWQVVDQGFTFSDDKTNRTINITNTWGRSGSSANLIAYQTANKYPVLIGNTIKRTGFSITYQARADWFSPNGLGGYTEYDYIASTAQAPTYYFGGEQLTCSYRLSLVRATKNISDHDVRAYLGTLDDSQFYDPWNKSIVMVLYDKYQVLGVQGSSAKNRVNKTLRFKGKKGGQRLSLAVNQSDGALQEASGYITQSSIFIVWRWNGQAFTWGQGQAIVLPRLTRMVTRCTYLDA